MQEQEQVFISFDIIIDKATKAEGFLYASGESAPGIISELMEEFIEKYIKVVGDWNDEASTKVYTLPMIIFTLQEAGTIEAFENTELF